MTTFSEIVPSIRSWSEYSDEKQINFNGYYVVHGGESVIIDPPELDAEGLADLKGLISKNPGSPLKGILLTNMHHDRMSQELSQQLSTPVFVNVLDEPGLDFKPDNVFREGDRLFCGIEVVQFKDQKSPGESGFFIADKKMLIVGDAVIGRNAGKLNLLPEDKYADIKKAKQDLARLKDLDFEVLLLGDGHSILSGAKQAVEEFLAD